MLVRAHTVRDRERAERADTSTCPGLAARRRKRTDHRAVDGHDPKYAIFRALPRGPQGSRRRHLERENPRKGLQGHELFQHDNLSDLRQTRPTNHHT